MVERLSFDPFGMRRSAQWQAPDYAFRSELQTLGYSLTTRGFTGHEHLDDFDLIHMNGRVYDPVIGRFLSADPFVQAPFNSQSYNRYSYVWNNPLSAVDPSGYEVVIPITDCVTWQENYTLPVFNDRPIHFNDQPISFIDNHVNFQQHFDNVNASRINVEFTAPQPTFSGGSSSSVSSGGGASFVSSGGGSVNTVAAQEGRDRSCGGRPCVFRGDSPGYAVGFSGSVTHPLYSIPATAFNMMVDDPFLPTGLSGGIWQSANSDKFSGALEIGAEYTAGLGSRIVGSLDFIEVGAVPDMEFSLVVGVGVRLYFQKKNLIGLGFSAGGGASWLTKPLSSKAVNVEIGGSLSKRVEW